MFRRGELERALSGGNPEVFTSGRVVPSGQGGFKVFAIRPGSVLEQLGIENGDRVTRVNGRALDSPDAVLEVAYGLRNSDHFEVELERRGQLMRLRYRAE